MRSEHERTKAIGIAAALCLALLAIVSWLVLHARPADSAVARATAPVPRAVEPSAAPELAAPQVVQRGRRVSETAPPEAAAVAQADATSSMENEADTGAEPKSDIIALVGDVSGRPGEVLGGPNTLVQLARDGEPRSVAISRGSYRIEDNEPGEYELLCSAPGLRYQLRTITLLPGETEHREDFVLEPVWTVAIRMVTTDGRNLRDPDVQLELVKGTRVNVLATQAPPPAIWSERPGEKRKAQRGSRWVPRLRSDEEIPGDPAGEFAGRLEIERAPPVYVVAELRGVVLASTRLDTEAKVATLEIPIQAIRGVACSLRGRIVAAENGAPLPRARATSFTGLGGGSIVIEPDADGNFLKAGLPPGASTLMLHGDDRGTDVRQIRLLPGTENDLGTIALAAGARIRGRFVDPEGATVWCDAEILPFAEDQPLETLNTRLVLGLDREAVDGFEMEGLAPGKYILMGDGAFSRLETDRWWNPPLLVDLSHGSIEDLVVRVDRPVKVNLHPASPVVRGLDWWVLASNGLLCAHGGFANSGDAGLSLGPGSFRLLVGEDAESAREISFTVGASPMTVLVQP